MKPPSPRTGMRAAQLPAVFFVGTSLASAVTWDNSAGTALWSTATNWDTDSEPSSASPVIFPAGLAGTVTLAAGELALSLQLDGAYTLSGGGLALASGNSIQVANGITSTVITPLNITGGLTKTGNGTLILQGANTNPGGTNLSAGKIRVTNLSALGAATIVTTVQANATLEIGNTLSLDRPVTLMGGAILAGQGTAGSIGKATIDASATSITLATDALADVFTIGNAVNELTGGSAGTVIGIGGPGAVRLGAASDFDGSWTIPSGRLELGAAGVLGDQATSSITLAGGTLAPRFNTATSFVTGPGNNLILTASSALVSDRSTLSTGLTHTFGSLSMGSHTLTVGPGPNVSPATTGGIVVGNVALSGNPVFTVNDTTALGKLTTGSLLGGASARAITKTGAGDLAVTGGATDLAAGSTLTASGGGAVELLFPNLGTDASVTISATQNPFGPSSFSLTDTTLRLMADGSGTAVAQTFVLPTAITLGGASGLDPDRRTASNSAKTFELPGLSLATGTVLEIGGGNAYGIRLSGGLALQGNATLQGSTAASKSGLLTLNGGILGAAGTVVSIGGGTSPMNLAIHAASTYGGGTLMSGSNVTLNAAAALGSGHVTLSGGTLTVNADDALVGTVHVNGGTLRVNDTDALESNTVAVNGGILDLRSNTTAGIVAGGIIVSGTSGLNFANNGSGTTQVITVHTLDVSGNTTLNLTAANSFVPNFTTIELAGNLIFTPAITTRVQSITEDGTPRIFAKGGAGTASLQGSSSHSGGTEVLMGILSVEHAAALGSGALTVGATSGLNAATAQFSAGLIIPNNLAVRSGSSGVMTFDSPTGGVTWNGAMSLQRVVTLDNGSATVPSTFAGAISGAGDVIKISAGEIAFGSAANSFGSGTASSVLISDGSLSVASDGALGNPANGVTLGGTDGQLKIDGSFSTARTLTATSTGTGVTVSAGRELTVTSPLAGTGSMLKAGTGIMTMGAAVNSSARGGAITGVTNGILRVQGIKNLSDTGPVTLNGAAGTIEFLRDANTTFPYPVIADGTGTLHVDRATGGSGSNGRHTLGTLSMASGNLTVTGGNGYGLSLGAATVSAANTITNNAGAPLILDSLLGNPANSNVALTIGGTGVTQINGTINEGAGTGNYGFFKTGPGTLRLGSSIVEFGGATTVRDGIFDLNGLNHTVSSLTMGGAASTLGANFVTGAGMLQLGGTFTLATATGQSGGAVFTGNLGLGSAVRTFSIANSTAPVDLTIDGPISGIAGAGISKSGAGVLRLSGAGNTQPGTVAVSAGPIEFAKTSGDAVGSSGLVITEGSATLQAPHQIHDSAPVTLSGATTIWLELNNFTETVGPIALTQIDGSDFTGIRTGATGTLVLNGNLTFNNNTDKVSTDRRDLLITGSGGASPSSDGTLDLGGVARTIHVATTTLGAREPLANATIETRIINGSIVKTGARTLYLSNPLNSFAGGIQINQGFIAPVGSNSLGTGPIIFGNGPGVAAGLDLSSASGTLPNDVTFGSSGDLELVYSAPSPQSLELSGDFTLQRDFNVNVVNGTVGRDSVATLHLSGGITDGAGTHALVKNGDGLLKLAAGNTYSGPTTIHRGSLEIEADSSLGDSALPLSINGGCLRLGNFFTISRGVNFSATGGSIRSESPAGTTISGTLDWGGGPVSFFGNGATVLSGSTTGTCDLSLGTPTAFATTSVAEQQLGSGHRLRLEGAAQLPGGNLSFDRAAVLELGNGNFTRPLGTGAGAFQMPTAIGAGWSANGADRIVNIGGAGETLIWGQQSPPFLYKNIFGNTVGALYLGSSSGTHTLIFENPLELNNGIFSVDRRVVTLDGPAAVDARLTGDLQVSNSFSAVFLQLDSVGTLDVAGDIKGDVHISQDGPGTTIFTGSNSFNTAQLDQGTWIFTTTASLGEPGYISVESEGTIDVSALPSGLNLGQFAGMGIYGTVTGNVFAPEDFSGNGHITGNLSTSDFGDFSPLTGATLHVEGNFTMGAARFFRWEIIELIPVTGYPQMRVGGTVNLDGILDYPTFLPDLNVGDSAVLLLNDGTDPIVGQFHNLPEGALFSIEDGLALQITYKANGDGGSVGNDFGFTVVQNTLATDRTISASAPLAVGFGQEFEMTFTLGNKGPGTVTGGHIFIFIPLGSNFISATPAGTFETTTHFRAQIPDMPAGGTSNVVLRFLSPNATGSLGIAMDYRGTQPDPDGENPEAQAVVAFLANAKLVLASAVRDPLDGSMDLTLNTLFDVRYLLEGSENLVSWDTLFDFHGNGQPRQFSLLPDEAKEFFRFRIIPYDDPPAVGP